MCNLFGGGKKPPKPPPAKRAPKPRPIAAPPRAVATPQPIKPPPKPPAPAKIMKVIDEISGIKTVTVKTPAGGKQVITARLPRTPQEDAVLKQGEQMMAKAIGQILTLSKYDPSSLVDFQPIIDTFANINKEQADALQNLSTFRDTLQQQRAADQTSLMNFGNIQQDVDTFKQLQSTLFNKEMTRQQNMRESDFSTRGIRNSTTADEIRSFDATNRELLRQQMEVNATLYGEDLAQRRLNRNLTTYEANEAKRRADLQDELMNYQLGEGQRANQLTAAQAKYALEQEKLNTLEGKRRTALNEQMGQFELGARLKGEDLAKAMASRSPDLWGQLYAHQHQNQLARYNAGVGSQQLNFQNQLAGYNAGANVQNMNYQNRLGGYTAGQNAQNMNYQNQLASYNAQPPSFGEVLGNVAGTVGGAMLTSPTNSLAGRLGTRAGNFFGI